MKNIVSTGSLFGELITVKQISKGQAKKLFASGEEIYLQSSNMFPFTHWQSIYPTKLDVDQLKSDIELNQFSINLYLDQVKEINESNDAWRKEMLPYYTDMLNTHNAKVINAYTQFETIVNLYASFNCDSERGKYVHFYTKIK